MQLHSTEPRQTGPSAVTQPRIRTRIRTSLAAAEYIGVSDSKLRKMRMEGTGPVFLVLSENRVGYLDADLDTWLDNRPRAVRTAEKEVA